MEGVELCQVPGVQPMLSRRQRGLWLLLSRPHPFSCPQRAPFSVGQQTGLLIGTF